MATYAEQLASVQAAIGAIEGGAQAYSIGNRSLTRADLKILYNREKFLQTMVNRETAGGLGVQYVYPEK